MISKVLFLFVGLCILYLVIRISSGLRPKIIKKVGNGSPLKCEKCNSYVIGNGPCLCES